MIDQEITHAARAICAAQSDKQDNSDSQLYRSGGWDHTIWMRLVEEGIRRGVEMERADHVATDDRHVSADIMAAALKGLKQINEIEQKAQALLLKAQGEYPSCDPYTAAVLVLERAIEQHEAFKQEVSDAVSDYFQYEDNAACKRLYAFIIPAPKPDPLVGVHECLEEAFARNGEDLTEHTYRFRAALEARGLKIMEVKNDD